MRAPSREVRTGRTHFLPRFNYSSATQPKTGRYKLGTEKEPHLKSPLHAAHIIQIRFALLKLLPRREKEFPRRLPQLAISPATQIENFHRPAAEPGPACRAAYMYSVLSLVKLVISGISSQLKCTQSDARAPFCVCVCGWRRKNKF